MSRPAAIIQLNNADKVDVLIEFFKDSHILCEIVIILGRHTLILYNSSDLNIVLRFCELNLCIKRPHVLLELV